MTAEEHDRACLSGQDMKPHGSALLRISVVVPVLNEEARIGRLLTSLACLGGVHEVIVVDGGSGDTTAERVKASGTRLVLSAPGRGIQMNAGARAATGAVLLFLHADAELPADALQHIAEALEDPRVVAGAFRTWTVADGPSRAWLGPLLHLADLRSRYTDCPYGDQALFVRADAFRSVGGFPEESLMEDLELSRRLQRIGRIRTVESSVRVSGRRFQARPLSSLVMMSIFPLLYRLGVPPGALARLYGNPR